MKERLEKWLGDVNEQVRIALEAMLEEGLIEITGTVETGTYISTPNGPEDGYEPMTPQKIADILVDKLYEANSDVPGEND